MADNIKVLAATGVSDPPVATDEVTINGTPVHVQRIKQGWGVDGTWNETADTDGIRFPVGGAQIGAINESAPASDIANSGLNGRLQRIAQRLTSLIALLPAALTAAGGLKTGTVESTLVCSVAAGAQVAANGIDLAGIRTWGVIVPTTFDGAAIGFSVSDTLTGAYFPAYDITNTMVTIPVGPGRYYDVPGEVMAARFLKITTDVNQTGTSTDFIVIAKS